MPVWPRVRLSLCLGPLLRAESGAAPPGAAADRYRGAAAAPAVNLGAGGGRPAERR